jgi:UDP-N-acetylglucosamine 1-carboxyvinyltransferase
MIHMTGLKKLGADVTLLDPHRIMVIGPTRWRGGGEIVCPPALRPAVSLFLAALGARGETIFEDTYVILRGYENLPARLNDLGANIQSLDP